MIKSIGIFLKSFILGGAALCLNLSSSTGSEAQPREWISQDGKHSVSATLVTYDRSTQRVTLLKENSTTVKVPIGRLSASDRSYVEAHVPKLSSEKGTVETMYGIDWQSNIEEALTIATGGATPADDRPVMWFRVLGEIDGGM